MNFSKNDFALFNLTISSFTKCKIFKDLEVRRNFSERLNFLLAFSRTLIYQK